MAENSVEMRGITKVFPGVVALDQVDFSCCCGEVHAVVGENGAGKSTLMKILSGVYLPDKGEIKVNGRATVINSPYDAQQLGISIIYQELNLLPDLNVAENVFLGREPRNKLGLLNISAIEEQAHDVLSRLGVDIHPRTPLRRLTVAQQQMVEIAKALSLNANIMIMDEPSATLGGADLKKLFEVIDTLKNQGVTVIYISHRLAEIFEVADRVTVFKDGKVVGTSPVAEIDRPTLVRMMIGRVFSETFPPHDCQAGKDVLTIKNMYSGKELQNINLTICQGEIVGLAGLTGSGRTELAKAIFGTRPIDGGEILLNGNSVQIKNPQDALKNSVGFLTEDRNEEGLVLDLSVKHNAALASLIERQRWGIIDLNREEKAVNDKAIELNIRTPNLNQNVEYLSGGNRQKVVLAKWLITNPDLIIFDEPTRGIDVGAKSEIWHLMRELARQGKAILMISSELPEVIGMSDRIVVMHRGHIVGELPGQTTSEEEVMMLATYGE